MHEPSTIQTLFSSLRHRNFRLFWIGQLVSLVGTWMQNVGQAWLVLELTHSSFKLGVVAALQFLPMLILSWFTGPFIDYLDKRKIIIWTQAVLMSLAFILSFLVWSGTVQYWHVVILATLLGIVNTVDMPARQSFLIDLVGKEDLMNAIAMNSSIFNAARAVGPAIAGMVIAWIGTAACFFINGLSFLAVLASLLFMTIPPLAGKGKPSYAVLRDMGEALSYIRNTPLVMRTMVLVSVVSIFGTNFNVLVPVFSKLELHRDAAAYGFLLSSFGTGALLGAVSMAFMSGHGPRQMFLLGGGMALSIVLVLLGLQGSYALTAFLLVLAGWSMAVFFGMANTTIQLSTDDRLRGRVMSLYTMSFGGFTPFGSMFAGAVAAWTNAPFTFALCGLICGIVFLTVIVKQNVIAVQRIN